MPPLFLALLVGWVASLSGMRAISAAVQRLDPPARPAKPVGTPAWWAQLVALAAGMCGLAAPLLGLRRGRTPRKPSAVQVGAGVALVVGGACLRMLSQLAMGSSWRVDVTPGERTALVTGGPFRLVRNPVYTTSVISIIGLVLVLPNPLSIAMLALFTLGLQVQVRLVEEPHLRATHPEQYPRYAARVGRFVPLLGRDTPTP